MNQNVFTWPNGLRYNAELRVRVGDLDLPERRRIPVAECRRKKAHRAALLVTKTRVAPTRWENVNFSYEEERNTLEEMREKDGCNMEKIGTLDSNENTIAIVGDRWRPQTAKKEGHKICTKAIL